LLFFPLWQYTAECSKKACCVIIIELRNIAMADGLTPGDRVIALAAAARSAALVGGAVASALAGWITKHKLTVLGVAFIAGALIGWIIGTMVGQLIFPAEKGKVMIAKRDPSSLPLILKGNIIASFISALVICLLAILIIKADIKAIAGPSISVSVIIGVVLAILASLI
jgi:hypothetical protein